MVIILRIPLKLNLTPNTSSCYGLINKRLFTVVSRGRRAAEGHRHDWAEAQGSRRRNGRPVCSPQQQRTGLHTRGRRPTERDAEPGQRGERERAHSGPRFEEALHQQLLRLRPLPRSCFPGKNSHHDCQQRHLQFCVTSASSPSCLPLQPRILR